MRSLNVIPRSFPGGEVVKKIHLPFQEIQEIGVLSMDGEVLWG